MEEKYIIRDRDTNSGVNTVLLVILLLIAVAAAVWYFAYYKRPAATTPTQNGLNVEVNLPANNDGTNGNNTTPSGY